MHIQTLNDGTPVEIRPPTYEDVDRMLAFFTSLPDEDRRYLKVHRLDRDRAEERVREALDGRAVRLLAVAGDRVVGDGALELSHQGWGRHLGEIRVFVAPEFRRKHLGALLIQKLFKEAEKREVEKVVARMAAPQVAARKVFERLGFHVDAVLPAYVTDAAGAKHDLVVMSCTLDEVWRELKDFYDSDHWPDG